jgi:hypothetical protein
LKLQNFISNLPLEFFISESFVYEAQSKAMKRFIKLFPSKLIKYNVNHVHPWVINTHYKYIVIA